MMKCTFVYPLLAALLVVPTVSVARERRTSDPNSPRVRTLVLAPARIDAAKSYSLLPSEDELTSGDAVALYTKAVQALPGNLNQEQIRNWLRVPLADLPQAEVQGVLQQAQTSLQQVELGSKCRSCDWPPVKPGAMAANLKEYRHLTFVLCLQARLQMAQGRFDDAVDTMRTSLAMAKQVGESPTIIQGMVGVAIGAMVLQQVEAMAQAQDSPSLYGALRSLPRPLVDLSKAIAAEEQRVKSSTQYNVLTRVLVRRQLKSSFQRVRQLMHRLDRDVATLQCIEALRHYAGAHNGQLPAQLRDITGVEVPENPATKKPFGYRLDGSKAVLDVAAPPGGRPRDAVRYEITLAP